MLKLNVVYMIFICLIKFKKIKVNVSMTLRKYLFATSNKNKFIEAKRILSKLDPEIIIEQLEIELPELQDTPEKISEHKCQEAYEIYSTYHYPYNKEYYQNISGIFTEDVSLNCYGLGENLPGPYIKHFINGMGLDKFYNLIKSTNDLEADALCYYSLNKFIDLNITKMSTVNGIQSGEIVKPVNTENSFGFDPIFQPVQFHKPFSSLTSDEKDYCSHRSIALQKLVKLL